MTVVGLGKMVGQLEPSARAPSNTPTWHGVENLANAGIRDTSPHDTRLLIEKVMGGPSLGAPWAVGSAQHRRTFFPEWGDFWFRDV